MTKPLRRDSKGRKVWPKVPDIEPDIPLNLKTTRTCLHPRQKVEVTAEGKHVQKCLRCDWSTPVEK